MLENKEKDIKHSLPILFVSSEATPFAPNGDLAAKVTNLATNAMFCRLISMELLIIY